MNNVALGIMWAILVMSVVIFVVDAIIYNELLGKSKSAITKNKRTRKVGRLSI